ncbi:hypothetical protein Zm00014a_015199 [Zea mays]|uniref:Uncharacterized protein n=1 Tax=Zea mays TaxID=4577 RepID=A0A3L6ENV2_MAIZE|nr:hypothetical protein Zm00014a_015199 [Zea mays]
MSFPNLSRIGFWSVTQKLLFEMRVWNFTTWKGITMQQ